MSTRPQFAQLLDKILTLGRIEHKVVFCHFRYHNIAPSPGLLLFGFHDLLGRLGKVLLVFHEAFDLTYGVLVPGYLHLSYKFTF